MSRTDEASLVAQPGSLATLTSTKCVELSSPVPPRRSCILKSRRAIQFRRWLLLEQP